MSVLVRRFLVGFSAFFLSFFMLLSTPYSQTRADKLSAMSHITQLPSLSYLSGYLQQRVALYRDSSSLLYPNMLQESKRDFVYAY